MEKLSVVGRLFIHDGDNCRTKGGKSMVKRHSIFKSLILSVTIFMLCTMTAFAANAAISNGSIYWLNHTQYTSQSFNASGGNIYLEGVATSANSGSFRITMEKKGILGWNAVGNQYTVNCGSYWTYNTRTGSNVQGQYFKRAWATGSGTYRFKLTKVSGNNQQVAFTQVYWFSE